jgi:transcriptional regulatory protein LevR/transcriptional regulator with AAA-type ATPase domain
MRNSTIIYNKLLELSDSKGINAQTLALLLGMSRSNVSHELNLLVKEGKITKSAGRPVLFFSKDTTSNTNRTTQLDELVMHNVSLKDAAEQAKAAILYPPKGLASLILGDTGVGKSMFASLMHNYAIEMGVKEKNSPFIVFNCADYSNNPQLLVAQLFGVKKGTFTGADSDKAGLLETADGGVLFLDEIHRLPPAGQEALFTFLDGDSFRRMGDNATRTSNVLIITATTEDPDSSLLQTFTRRIPIMIKIPSLKERTFDERLYLIKHFFKNESVKLNRELFISCNTIRAFLSYDCRSNIGQLKSDIQLICAKAYSEFLTNLKNDVRINSRNLPPHIREGLLKEKEHRILWNKLTGEEIEFFRFSPTMEHTQLPVDHEDNSIYEIIEEKLNQLKLKGISNIDIEHILEKDISKHFQKYISGISENINKMDILNLLGENILNCVDDVIEYMSTSLNRTFSNNIYTALALHINTLIKRLQNKKNINNPQLNQIKELYPKEFEIASNAKPIINKYLHHNLSEDEVGYLTIFLLPENAAHNVAKNKVKIILIAHGEATATSMVNVANRLLGENYTIAIDAPLDVSPSTVLDRVRDTVRQDMNSSGYLFLVDMGSLTTFSDIIESEFKIPAKAISLVSTLHVIEATRKALLGFSLEEIYKDVLLLNSHIETSRGVKYSQPENHKIAIITTCLTGEGGSVAVKSILNNSLKYDKELFEIITLSCLDKACFKQDLARIKEEREILFIVSSFPVDADVKQYNMYDVISMSVISELQENIDVKATLVKMPSVLKENIQNLDGFMLFHDVNAFLKNIENSLTFKLKDAVLIGLILHVAFMISRLKKGETTDDYPNKHNFIDENQRIYHIIKENCNILNNKYSTNISDNEICYLMDHLLNYLSNAL